MNYHSGNTAEPPLPADAHLDLQGLVVLYELYSKVDEAIAELSNQPRAGCVSAHLDEMATSIYVERRRVVDLARRSVPRDEFERDLKVEILMSWDIATGAGIGEMLATLNAVQIERVQ